MRVWGLGLITIALRRHHLFVGSSCADLASSEELAISPGLLGRAIPRELLARLGTLPDTPGPLLGERLRSSQAHASPPLKILAYSSSVGACNYCRCDQPVAQIDRRHTSYVPPWEPKRWWQGRYTATSNDCGCGWPGRLARGLGELLPSANYHVTNHGKAAASFVAIATVPTLPPPLVTSRFAIAIAIVPTATLRSTVRYLLNK